jgi:hypothetical protein
VSARTVGEHAKNNERMLSVAIIVATTKHSPAVAPPEEPSLQQP